VASCRIWDALGFKRIGRVKGCGNLKSYPGELVDAIIYGRDLGQEDDFISEERFDKIRFYLKNGKYPNGADRAEKSRLRSAATHYKLTAAKDNEPEKLWLKGKEVIADPQKQYEIARDIHHKTHGGINKTTAAIAELYHWVRIKETVSQVIRNCPECSEMNKGLSAMRQGQNERRKEAQAQNSSFMQPHTQSLTPTPPIQYSPPQPPPRTDSPSNQLQMESAQHQDGYAQFPQHNEFDLPVDPALMDALQRRPNHAELPPSPFLHIGQGLKVVANMSGAAGVDHTLRKSSSRMSIDTPNMDERASAAGQEMRRRLDRVAAYDDAIIRDRRG
jgi:hypothetical protein